MKRNDAEGPPVAIQQRRAQPLVGDISVAQINLAGLNAGEGVEVLLSFSGQGRAQHLVPVPAARGGIRRDALRQFGGHLLPGLLHALDGAHQLGVLVVQQLAAFGLCGAVVGCRLPGHLLVVPLLTLCGAAARLSTRRRDDRLATLRLLGAPRRMIAQVTVLEATFLALAGSARRWPSPSRPSTAKSSR